MLAPSERYHRERGQRHKQLTDWARQMLFQVRQWLPERMLVVVADSSYAALELLATCQCLPNPVTMVTRLRLDAALYAPAYAHPAGRPRRPRKKGVRQPNPGRPAQRPCHRLAGGQPALVRRHHAHGSAGIGNDVWYHSGLPSVSIRCVLVSDPDGKFESQTLLSTDPNASPTQIVEWFVRRWQLEVTFEEARAHLGIETQRQWSDLAIVRTTPLLLWLFSLVMLFAHHLLQGGGLPVRAGRLVPQDASDLQ